LLTHNDKGGRAELYALNPENGQITATYELSGVSNTDWEELAQSPEHVFVADMGNNDGERTDLRIYKIAKSDLTAGGGTVPVAAVIDFHYPEQQVFFPVSKHNWDAEALFWANGALYLFTKNRLDAQTVLYRIPDEAGDHAALKLGSFNAGVRITGATMSTDGQKVVLLGYNKDEQCVLWELSGFSGQDFLGGQKQRIVLGNYSSLGQMEGLDFGPDGVLYLTAEASGGQAARLYRFE
jgi:hypothetical protein